MTFGQNNVWDPLCHSHRQPMTSRFVVRDSGMVKLLIRLTMRLGRIHGHLHGQSTESRFSATDLVLAKRVAKLTMHKFEGYTWHVYPFLTLRHRFHRNVDLYSLTHWGRDKMDATPQTTFSNTFSWMKTFESKIKFHWNIFLIYSLSNWQCGSIV